MRYSGNNLIAVFVFTVVLFGCTNAKENEKPSYTDTSLFKAYLKSEYEKVIPDEAHLFVLIPRFGCYGCMQRALLEFRKTDESVMENRVTFIISNRNPNVLASMPDNAVQLSDSLGAIDQLDLKLSGMRFLHTKKGRVISNEGIEIDEPEKVRKMVKLLLEQLK